MKAPAIHSEVQDSVKAYQKSPSYPSTGVRAALKSVKNCTPSSCKSRSSKVSDVCETSLSTDSTFAAFRLQCAATAAAGILLTGVSSSSAADFAKVGACLLQHCPIPLAECIADGTCAQNIACLQNCNGRSDETECQIKCGDLYASPAVENFNKCAVTQARCVPQRVDRAAYPVPPDSALDTAFDLKNFQGRWAITAGLNTLFDTFDCQVHQFKQDGERNLTANIEWRIPNSDGDFIERHTVQTFDQDPSQPGFLHNGNNEFLSYTDDWYILGFKPDAFAVIYYRGNNDAWAGYGGATVYTRDLQFPERYKPEIEASLEKVGLRLGDFKLVDNSCPPHPQVSPIRDVIGAFKDINPAKQPTASPPIDMDESKFPNERAGLSGTQRSNYAQ